MVGDLGKKITCKKCGTKYYSLGKKVPRCPACKLVLIPKGTVAHVKLEIKPGGYNDDAQGWLDGFATRGSSGAIYLNCQFTVISGTYKKRKIYSLIGLKSPKGPFWGNKGRTQIKNIINSAYKLSEQDQSPEAKRMRVLNSLGDLDGLEFKARIDVKPDSQGKTRNEFADAVIEASSAVNDSAIEGSGLLGGSSDKREKSSEMKLESPIWFSKRMN